MRRNLPPLAPLRAFDAVMRLGSVTEAAQELGRTHGAVSRQLRLLQDGLGVELFEKAGTGIRPNRRGKDLHRAVTDAFDILERENERLQGEIGLPDVWVGASPTFAMRWMAPRLRSFYAENPAVTIHMSLAAGDTAGGPGAADILLSWDALTKDHSKRSDAESLGDAFYGPVCAPNYPLALSDGGGHAPMLVTHRAMPQSWKAWEALAGLALTADASTEFDHAYLCIEAAAAGVGVALLERRLVAEELADGRLRAPFGFVRVRDGLLALVAEHRRKVRTVRLVLDWLKREAQDCD